MGDRFYEQQRAHFGKGRRSGPLKTKRRLKKDIVKSIEHLFNCESLPSLTKMTIADLDKMEDMLKEMIDVEKNAG